MYTSPNDKNLSIENCTMELLGEEKKVAYILKADDIVAPVGYRD